MLRTKPISKGRKTLYLDFYPAIAHPNTGKQTRHEFLRLYLFSRPKTPADKEQKAETLALAETIRARRQIEVQAGSYGFLSKKNLDTCFVKYCERLAEERVGINKTGWESMLIYLNDFSDGSLKQTDLTETKCRDFRNFLLTSSKRSDISY
ncbi:Arm DNA-binding domain-containing protein [Spirosoma endophyticum]|nr:Arm DNA-binding domain-containing protein [Spirosoma endophyticum]